MSTIQGYYEDLQLMNVKHLVHAWHTLSAMYALTIVINTIIICSNSRSYEDFFFLFFRFCFFLISEG